MPNSESYEKLMNLYGEDKEIIPSENLAKALNMDKDELFLLPLHLIPNFPPVKWVDDGLNGLYAEINNLKKINRKLNFGIELLNETIK